MNAGAGAAAGSPLASGERVLIVDAKGRRYLVELRPGASFHTHAGIVAHDDMINMPEGSVVQGSTGRRFLVLRPTLGDVVLKMPRGAQVIYPKDLAVIVEKADVTVGTRVFEAGVGSGALSMALLRAGAEVVGYEARSDFAARARQNVAAFVGGDAKYEVEERDAYLGIDGGPYDRVVLDLPEPWRVLAHAAKELRAGGILVAYLPTINQVAELRGALGEHGFGLAETIEVLQRSWHVEARSVRPDHRMVAHTGFLTTARLLARDAALAWPEAGRGLGLL
jgi:tRNA (adenine57-N1/adenine58-N1)-methyltransferase